MTFDQIIKDIKASKYSPIYFLHGEEPYYIDKISDLIENKVLNEGEKSFNQVVIYGKDADFKVVVDEARQFPMMSSYRVIIIKEAQDMKTLTELTSYLEKPSNSSILVFCYKYKKLDKRTKFAKLLDDKATVFESKKLYDNQVAAWVKDYIHQLGYKADAGVPDILAEYLGADLSKISNELDKLILNVPNTKPISVADVKDQIGISKEFDVFELNKVLGEKNFTKAAMIIRYFAQNPSANPAIVTVSSLFGYFTKVYTAKYHTSLSDAELAKLTGVSPFFLKEYRIAAKNYTIPHLFKIFQVLKVSDQHCKGVGIRRGDDGAILKDILIACMG
jgi:DNA polymerase III subunit delta